MKSIGSAAFGSTLIGGLIIGIVCLATNAPAAQLQSQKVVVSGLHNVYAPFTFKHQISGQQLMYSGGWKTPQDQTNDIERLFYCPLDGASTCQGNTVHPVVWTNHSLPGQVPGYHVNDPTVIHPYGPAHTNKNWVYMYYTALPDASAATTDCRDLIHNNSTYDPAQPGCIGVVDGTVGIDGKDHVIAFASGTDGVNFYDHGPILNDPEGVWSPSAVTVGSEIWIYYHDAVNVKIHRQRLQLNGFSPIGVRQTVSTAGYASGLINVDVQKWGNGYVMLANTIGDQKIVRLVSTDGLNFSKAATDSISTLVNAGAGTRVPGPHTEKISSLAYRVYMGYDTSGTNTASQSMHSWLYLDQQ